MLILSGMKDPAVAGTVAPPLRTALATLGPDDDVPVIIKLTGTVNLETINDREKSVRRSKIVTSLRESAAVSQKQLATFLRNNRTKKIRQLWIINGLAVTVPASLVDEIAQFPGVAAVMPDGVTHAPVTSYGAAAEPEWNIAAIHARNIWNLGYTGQGVVVANMDSGVNLDHPDLQGRWRGGTNSWFDPNGEHAVPADVDGHGTQTMGIMVGGDAGGSFIGVAPGARWIAVKIFNDAGDASDSVIHEGFQWLLDPDGDPATNDAPDVVNISWGFKDPTHGCITEFQPDVQALKAAQIALSFSAGNDGPNPATSLSPANYAESFAVGAVDAAHTIAGFSSRGPSACGGIYPNVVAPGVNVLSSGLNTGIPGAEYAVVSGTSFAAPHVAGAMALLLSAVPSLDVSMLEAALMNSATDLGSGGPDNAYGNGLIELSGAYRFLKKDRVAVYRNGLWYADRSGNVQWDGEVIDSLYRFGFADALPVSGDWTGDGVGKLGLYHNGAWTLDTTGSGTLNAGNTTCSFGVGLKGAAPVTGDWKGTGTTKIGVYADGTWYLDLNGNGAWDGTPTDGRYSFGVGLAGAIPATGDWTGTGSTKIGVYADGTWYLDLNGNGAWDGTPTDGRYSFGAGLAGAIPVTGDWTGTGSTKIGVYTDGTWYLDLNGNGAWDATPTDGAHTFGSGLSGAVPVVGRW
ncbi:S8 family serine peptidase [Geomobilimonas luticola]|uniref:S8 family serine peptidase n=1 Tax=Geomobilimonas luticola TaxID=1114878 RepID=A0ABS5SF53_9BACT|nr:S8 family serine peptidase [Geomobilimonas luticola]MBT0653144.1 S8 family serine peptidase [Geomobilimonas luticola]